MSDSEGVRAVWACKRDRKIQKLHIGRNADVTPDLCRIMNSQEIGKLDDGDLSGTFPDRGCGGMGTMGARHHIGDGCESLGFCLDLDLEI